MLNNPENISLGFVIYKAESSLTERIRLAEKAGFRCYIFDNSPENQVFNENFNGNSGCKYITAGKNVGLGFGISCICGQAYYEGFRALLFFDQDTVFDTSTLEFINSFYKQKGSIENEYSSVVFNSKTLGKTAEAFEIKDVLLTISSGSLFFLKRLKDINWHDESFFVDLVDYEFCLNSSNHNLKIGECSNTPGFDHVSEQADSEYKIFWKKRMMREYSFSRISGTITAGMRLIFRSLRSLNLKYTYAIFRSLSIYLYFQILVRILNFIK
jgi:GT2 family glycosyltransferase